MIDEDLTAKAKLRRFRDFHQGRTAPAHTTDHSDRLKRDAVLSRPFNVARLFDAREALNPGRVARYPQNFEFSYSNLERLEVDGMLTATILERTR